MVGTVGLPDDDGGRVIVRQVGASTTVTNKQRSKLPLCRSCLSPPQVAPRVLTWPQLAEAAADTLRRRLSPTAAAAPPYRPNFQRSTVKHFLLHAGGLITP